MYAFLKLIRFENILFIIFTQFLIKFSLFEAFKISVTLNFFNFSLLVIATICIAASGYVINDIYDKEADRINKPKSQVIGNKISEKSAYTIFIILNITGVGIGFYLSNLIDKPGFSGIFIFTSAILYIYAVYLKGMPFIGNVVISILVALVVIIIGLFDLLPAITPQNKQTQATMFSILLDYAFFAFLINLIREMVKDQEDVNGDHNMGLKTLSVVLGKERTNKIIFALGLIPLVAVVYYLYKYLFDNTASVLYFLFLIVAPLLYFLIQIWTAKSIKEYSRLSRLLKIILFFGFLSIGLHQFLVK